MLTRLYSTIALLAAVALLQPAARAANRDALRQIVQTQCVIDWVQRHNPAPCLQVYLPDGDRGAGYAVLADQKGGAHFLLIPTQTISGIESPALFEHARPNYFAAAWRARDWIRSVVAQAGRRDQIGLAINAPYSRGQDQLHIHIECLGPAVYDAMQTSAAHLSARWSPIAIGRWNYQALRVMGASLDGIDPFALLADRLPGARDNMGAYTLVVAGMQFTQGPGFVLLAGKAVPGGEHLLDATCAVALRKGSHQAS